MKIPKQLQNPDFRFVLLGKWNVWKNTEDKKLFLVKPEAYDKLDKKKFKPLGKAPFEKSWATENNYKFNDVKLLNHIEEGKNFGIIGGHGKLRILDIDSKKLGEEFEKKLNTFTIKTGSGGRHFYFLSDYDKNHVLVNEQGELRAKNYQVVSSPCRHPTGNYYKVVKDIPIQEISKEELYDLIKPYLREEQTGQTNTKETGKDTSRSGLEYRKILALLRAGKSRKEIYKTMEAYSKWASATEQYKSLTFEKAENFYLLEEEGAEENKIKNILKPSKQLFLDTKKILMKYIDTSELNYNLITTWTLGTYFHNQFETYPLLILMARKQSGKTRTLKLISFLSYGSDGSISTSITETSLFRHPKGAIFFDEMESISSKEKTALRETINSVYKKGNKITRYAERKIDGQKKYVEENFYPFYPLGIANIYGFGDVLTDRSLQIILQRSGKAQTQLIEDFSTNPEILDLKNKLTQLNVEIPEGIFTEWNNFIQNKTYSKELKPLFEKISKTKIIGRPLELFFPLFLIAERFDVLDLLINTSKEYLDQLEGEFIDNVDDLLQNFMDTQKHCGFVSASRLLLDFKNSLEEPEEYMNSKWFGRALKRLGLIKKKRLVDGRVQIKLNNMVELVEFVDSVGVVDNINKNTKIANNNSTNTTNTTNSTNSTNSTNNKVEYVDKKELVDNIKINSPQGELDFSELNKAFENE